MMLAVRGSVLLLVFLAYGAHGFRVQSGRDKLPNGREDFERSNVLSALLVALSNPAGMQTMQLTRLRGGDTQVSAGLGMGTAVPALNRALNESTVSGVAVCQHIKAARLRGGQASEIEFHDAAINAIDRAFEIAIEYGHMVCAPAHLAASIFSDDSGARACKRAGVDLVQVRDTFYSMLQGLPKQMPAPEQLAPDASFDRVIDAAVEDMMQRGDKRVLHSNLMAGLYEDPQVARALRALGMPESTFHNPPTRKGKKAKSKITQDSFEEQKKYGADELASTPKKARRSKQPSMAQAEADREDLLDGRRQRKVKTFEAPVEVEDPVEVEESADLNELANALREVRTAKKNEEPFEAPPDNTGADLDELASALRQEIDELTKALQEVSRLKAEGESAEDTFEARDQDEADLEELATELREVGMRQREAKVTEEEEAQDANGEDFDELVSALCEAGIAESQAVELVEAMYTGTKPDLKTIEDALEALEKHEAEMNEVEEHEVEEKQETVQKHEAVEKHEAEMHEVEEPEVVEKHEMVEKHAVVEKPVAVQKREVVVMHDEEYEKALIASGKLPAPEDLDPLVGMVVTKDEQMRTLVQFVLQKSKGNPVWMGLLMLAKIALH